MKLNMRVVVLLRAIIKGGCVEIRGRNYHSDAVGVMTVGELNRLADSLSDKELQELNF